MVVVVSDRNSCQGGDLWIQREDGDEIRTVAEGKTLKGIVFPISRNPLVFDPKQWHGTTLGQALAFQYRVLPQGQRT